MFRLALANLFQGRSRTAMSTIGVGLALTLVLFFGAVFKGAESRLTVYIDHAGADLWVSQEGVLTMHMSDSALPISTVDDARAVAGVVQAEPLLYTSDILQAHGRENISYVFGVRPGSELGAPWNVSTGRAPAGPGEILIDRAIAGKLGVGLGDSVTALGRQFVVVGLNAGTSSVVSAVAFISFDDFATVRGGGDVTSYVLVQVAPGRSPAQVQAALERALPGATIQSSASFAKNERSLVKDMSADLIGIVNDAGFLTGLAVVALTVYVATTSRRREYGILKAVGVGNGRLVRLVLLQATITVALGFAAATAMTSLLASLVPRFNELLVLSLTEGDLLRVGAISLILGALASLLPALQLTRLAPTEVLRKG